MVWWNQSVGARSNGAPLHCVMGGISSGEKGVSCSQLALRDAHPGIEMRSERRDVWLSWVHWALVWVMLSGGGAGVPISFLLHGKFSPGHRGIFQRCSWSWHWLFLTVNWLAVALLMNEDLQVSKVQRSEAYTLYVSCRTPPSPIHD